MEVNGVFLHDHTPSVIPTWRLYCWTKYMVGGLVKGYRYGAVKPPNPDHNWLPAAISNHTILVACTKTFPTAEKAVDWLQAAGHVK